jgi:DNA-binding GntR family transcriptional regulator
MARRRAERGEYSLPSTLPQLPGATTLPSQIYNELETAIINGILQPGQRLHADDLAEHYGISRIPVREALSSLARAGWVEITPRHGVHVRQRDPQELQDLFEFRADVEALVARWAAERRTDEDLASLQRAVETSRAATGNTNDQQMMAYSAQFRDALRTAAHNSVLAATSAQLEKRAQFYFSAVVHHLGIEWMHVHQQILKPVRQRDAETAATLAARHITATGAAVRDLLFAHELPGRPSPLNSSRGDGTRRAARSGVTTG